MTADAKNLDRLKIDHAKRRSSRSPAIAITAAVLVVVVAGLIWVLTRPVATEVQVATARETVMGQRSTVLNASGYVVARRRATVSSKVTGQVAEV